MSKPSDHGAVRLNETSIAQQNNLVFVLEQVGKWNSLPEDIKLSGADRKAKADWTNKKAVLNERAKKEAARKEQPDGMEQLPGCFANVAGQTIYVEKLADDGTPITKVVADFEINVISKKIAIERATQIDYELEFKSPTHTLKQVIKAEHASDVRAFRKNYCSTDFNFFADTDLLLKFNSRVLRTSDVPTTYTTSRVGIQRHPVSQEWVWVSTDFTVDKTGDLIADFTFNGQDDEGKFKSTIFPSDTIDEEVKQRLRDHLFSFNAPQVCAGTVGWHAANFFKSHIMENDARWPVAYLLGLAGSGKTTTGLILRDGFYGAKSRTPENFFGSTNFARQCKNTISTTYPFLWDEIKPEKDDKKLVMWKDAVNALYNNSSIEKGKANLSTVSYRFTTPIMATGENKKGDKSTFDRCLIIDFDKHASHEHEAHFKALQSSDLAALGSKLLFEALSMENVQELYDHYAALIDKRIQDRPRHNAAVALMGAALVADAINADITEEYLAAQISSLFIDSETGRLNSVESEVDKVLDALEHMRANHEASSTSTSSNGTTTTTRTEYQWKNHIVEGEHFVKVTKIDGLEIKENHPIAYNMKMIWPTLKSWADESKSYIAYDSHHDFIKQFNTHKRFIASNRKVRFGDTTSYCIIVAQEEE